MSTYRFNYFAFRIENCNFQQLPATFAMKPPILQIIHIFEGENVEMSKYRFNYFEFLLENLNLQQFLVTPAMKPPIIQIIHIFVVENVEMFILLLRIPLSSTSEKRFPTSAEIFWSECADSEIWWWVIWGWIFHETGTNVKPRGEDTKRKRFSMATAIFLLEGADFEIWLEIAEKKNAPHPSRLHHAHLGTAE